jgi:maltooligosyltrehalose synthase
MPPAIPIATYRLQLSADFDFDAAASVVPYLKALGITHLYASPFMRARKGSTHGYDVTDHARFNPELGGEEGFERLSAVLRIRPKCARRTKTGKPRPSRATARAGTCACGNPTPAA